MKKYVLLLFGWIDPLRVPYKHPLYSSTEWCHDLTLNFHRPNERAFKSCTKHLLPKDGSPRHIYWYGHTHIGETVCVHISHTQKALCHPALAHKAYCQSIGWRAGVTVGARREEDWARMSFSKWDWVSNREEQQNINKMVRKAVSSCSVSHNLVSGVTGVHRSIGLNFLGYSQIIIGVIICVFAECQYCEVCCGCTWCLWMVSDTLLSHPR